MRHLDLFSGIGGFALAAREVWGDEHEIISFCEINKYAQQVLKKHWPDAPCCEDIRRLNHEFIANAYGSRRIFRKSKEQSTEDYNEALGQFEPSLKPPILCDLLTGGFPCQPFSNAGKRKGKDDDRYLWPEMLRVIQEFKPRWIIGENVAGIINMALDQVCVDLESAGYEVEPVIIPACAVNAPHRRDRVWIIGHRIANSGGVCERDLGAQERTRSAVGREGEGRVGESGTYSGDERLQGSEQCGALREGGSKAYVSAPKCDEIWRENWVEVATQLCGVDDGLPAELDGFKLSKAAHRVERLKGLGNAIVPQVAIEIMKKIKTIETTKDL